MSDLESDSRLEPVDDLTAARPSAGILRSSATYTAVGMAQRAIGFVLLPIYARVLTPSDYGTVAVLLTIAGAAQLLLSFGLETAVFRGYFMHEDGPDRRVFINTLGWFLIVAPIAIVLPLGGLSAASNGFGLARPWYVTGELLAAALTVAASTMPLAFVRARENLRSYVIINAANAGTVILTKAVLVLGLKWGVAGWVLSDIAGGAAMLAMAVIFSGHRWSRDFSKTVLRAALVLGIPLLPHLMSHWLLALSDRLILGAIVSSHDVGVYSMGYQFAVILGLVLTEMNRAILPVYGRAIGSETERSRLNGVASFQVSFTAVLGAAAATVGPTLVRVLLPHAYHEAGAVIPALALSYVFFGWYFVPMNLASIVAGETKFVFIPTVSAASLNVVLNLVLVPKYGIQAAAINTAIGYALLFVAITIYARRRTSLTIRLDWSPILAAVGLTAAAIGLAVVVLPSSGLIAPFLQVAAFVPALCVVGYQARESLTTRQTSSGVSA